MNQSASYTASGYRSILERAWKEMRRYVVDKYPLPLLDAANCIGLRVFPVGWNFREFGEAGLWRPYSQSILDLTSQHALPEFAPSDDGHFASLRACAVRRRCAEKRFSALLHRYSMRVILYGDDCRAREASFTLLNDVSTEFDFPTGGLTSREMSWSACVHNMDVLNAVETAITASPRSAKHDWLHFEKWVRHHFECHGATTSSESVYRAYLDFRNCRSVMPVDLTRSTALEKIRLLRFEYAESDEAQ